VPLVAAAAYTAGARQALLRLKRRPELAVPLARWMIVRLAPFPPFGADWLVPVPLHPRRLAERGYNQAALLSAALARPAGARSRPMTLSRCRDTDRQAGQTRADREHNVSGAFVARPSRRLAGKQVVLVDDVVTTGATALGCIAALREAGALVSGILALSRAGADLPR
jgi:ComF family protein